MTTRTPSTLHPSDLSDNTSDGSVGELVSEDLISDEAFYIFQWIFYAGFLLIIACFGIITNIINIICFAKQGLKDTVNVSLLGLAASDLGCMVTALGSSICWIPAVQESDVPVDANAIQYLVFGWPHLIFARITAWFTALITMERCLCVITPLKVKTIVTTKRVIITMICIVFLVVGSFAPAYYANRFAFVFSPVRNQTILGLIPSADRAIVEQIFLPISNFFVPFTAFGLVSISTGTLVIQLRKKIKWRLKSTTPASADLMSERDQKVARMVVVISSLFIACFIPLSFIIVAMIVEPELAVDGKYKNVLYVLSGPTFFLHCVNSAMNIFIYYHMSSRFKAAFTELFARKKK